MARWRNHNKTAKPGFGPSKTGSKENATTENEEPRSDNPESLSTLLRKHRTSKELKSLEPLLKIYAQSGTTNPKIYKALLEIAEHEGNITEIQKWSAEWSKYPSSLENELWKQLRITRSLGDKTQERRLLSELCKRGRQKRPQALYQNAKHAILNEKWREAITTLKKIKEIGCWTAQAEAMQAVCIFEDTKSTKKIKEKYATQILDTKPTFETRQLKAAKTRAHFERGLAPYKANIDEDTRKVNAHGAGTERLLVPVLIAQGKLDAAQQICESLLKLSSNLSSLRFFYSECLLRSGKLHEGFKARTKIDTPNQLNQEKYTKTIYCDGTLSESLFYCKWIKYLRHKDTIVHVQPPLVNLLQKNYPNAIFLPLKNKAEHIKSKHLRISSLPAIIEEWENDINLFESTLKIEESLLSQWGGLLNKHEGEWLIGINWHGSALRSSKQTLTEDIELESFAELAQQTNCKLVSLQKGTGKEQLGICTFRERFHEKQNEINAEHRLEHIAAIIMNCDLIICDNSGPAHLSSHLGQNTIINTRATSEWHWHQQDTANKFFPNTITSVYKTNWANSIKNGWNMFQSMQKEKTG